MPSAILSPNVKSHWAKKANQVKRHKNAIIFEMHRLKLEKKPIKSYQIHFVFQDQRRRDFDNFTAMCKSYLDGISSYIEQDDSKWEMEKPTKEVVKGCNPHVIITLNEL